MRNYYSLFGSAMAAAAIAELATTERFIDHAPVADFSKPKRRRTGKKYPHSSDRHDARIARQLAAGQIRFIQHGPRG